MTQTVVGADRGRSLVTVLLIVVGASVVIGGILSTALFLGASSFSGAAQPVAPLPHATATEVSLPTAAPTGTPADDDQTEPAASDPADDPTQDPTGDPTEDPTAEAIEDAQPTGISLSASATSVGSQELVSLSGTFDGPDGTVLQVQRRLEGGGWGDFGVQATVRNGEYTTRVRSGRVGTNEFRLRDGTGTLSNVVEVTVA